MLNSKMFLSYATLGALLCSAPVSANPTFENIVAGGVYFTETQPCAYQVAKDPLNFRLQLKPITNPLYWFRGDTNYDARYSDPYGIERRADLCGIRGSLLQYTCKPDLDFCTSDEGFSNLFRLLPNGELVDTVNSDQTVASRRRLYTLEDETQSACHQRDRAEAAISVLETFIRGNLETECTLTIEDTDAEVTKKYFRSDCIERNLLPISVASANSRLWTDVNVALAAQAFRGNRDSCIDEIQYEHRLVSVAKSKCTRQRLTNALDVLRRMADASAQSCNQAP